MRFDSTVEVKSNLELTCRERGKIVSRRVGHNIWLNLGREYLAKLIAYSLYGDPGTPEEDMRIRYMGLGIGGVRQVALGVANNSPLGGNVPPNAYAGTNAQTDLSPSVTTLERPVRISGGSTDYNSPVITDVWLGQCQIPTHPTATQTNFRRLFTEDEISYAPFLTVPLSEVMLFTNGTLTNPNYVNQAFNTGVAYDTFDSLSKTNAFTLEISWTVRF